MHPVVILLKYIETTLINCHSVMNQRYLACMKMLILHFR